MRKWNIDNVRSGLSEYGYTLLDKEYKNVENPMNCICSEGHSCKVRWKDFRNGHRCKKCYNEKINIEFVEEKFLEKGFKLLSKEYKNSQTKLEFECSNGHIDSVTWGNFKKKKRCAVCHNLAKRPKIDDIKLELSRAGLLFISMENYDKGKTSVNIKCNKGHISTVFWSDFVGRGSRCPKCNLSVKYTIEEVKDIANKFGYRVLSENYNSNKDVIYMICPVGHNYSTRWNYFISGNRCGICERELRKDRAKAKRVDIKKIEGAFLSEGYRILKINYKNAKSPIICECANGHLYKTNWNKFGNCGYRCSICSRGNVSPVSQKWLDELNVPVENREILLPDLKITVDGFDKKSNTAYEFFGDYWHGNPDVYDLKLFNRSSKKTFGLLYEETKTRVSRLEEAGYKVIYIWERDFKMEK